jgi:hypothetical protein
MKNKTKKFGFSRPFWSRIARDLVTILLPPSRCRVQRQRGTGQSLQDPLRRGATWTSAVGRLGPAPSVRTARGESRDGAVGRGGTTPDDADLRVQSLGPA